MVSDGLDVCLELSVKGVLVDVVRTELIEVLSDTTVDVEKIDVLSVKTVSEVGVFSQSKYRLFGICITTEKDRLILSLANDILSKMQDVVV